jgi:DNA-binding NtrC family response regulator
VLVVDDEAPLARALAGALADDHDVEIAITGEKALAMMAARRFDVVLCDLMMVDLSGMDVYDEIVRRDPELAARFVFMTGGAFTPRAAAFLAATRNPRIEKPFDLDEVARVIAELGVRD